MYDSRDMIEKKWQLHDSTEMHLRLTNREILNINHIKKSFDSNLKANSLRLLTPFPTFLSHLFLIKQFSTPKQTTNIPPTPPTPFTHHFINHQYIFIKHNPHTLLEPHTTAHDSLIM